MWLAVVWTTPRVPRVLRCPVQRRVQEGSAYTVWSEDEEGARVRAYREKRALRTIGMLIRFAPFLGFFVLFCECRSSADDLVECVARLVEPSEPKQPRPRYLLFAGLFLDSMVAATALLPVRGLDAWKFLFHG